MLEKELICQECNQEYTLSGEDNPEEFECECGGSLKLVKKTIPSFDEKSDINKYGEVMSSIKKNIKMQQITIKLKVEDLNRLREYADKKGW